MASASSRMVGAMGARFARATQAGVLVLRRHILRKHDTSAVLFDALQTEQTAETWVLCPLWANVRAKAQGCPLL